MRWITLSIGIWLVGASLSWAFDEPKKKTAAKQPPAKEQNETKKPGDESVAEQSVAEQIEAVQNELAAMQQKIIKKFQAAQDDAERSKLRDEYFSLASKVADKYAAIVEKHPGDEAVFPALEGMFGSDEYAAKAVDVVIKHHLENERLGMLCLTLAGQPGASAEKLLRAVVQKSKSDKTKGLALLGLGQMLFASSNQDGLDDTKRDELRTEAEQALKSVVEKYADLAAGPGNAGDVAGGLLFEVQHLAVGKEVPDLEGEDLEGTDFKLSDYRGKVVFLDFWAHW